MTDTNYRDWLAQASYKPGYHLSMHGRVFGIHFTYADAWGWQRRGDRQGTEYVATVDGSYTVPPGLGERDFYRVISDVILRECEDHERREWFKVGGVCFDDPHRPNTPVGPDEIARRAAALLS
jgi:hypothetical protein